MLNNIIYFRQKSDDAADTADATDALQDTRKKKGKPLLMLFRKNLTYLRKEVK